MLGRSWGSTVSKQAEGGEQHKGRLKEGISERVRESDVGVASRLCSGKTIKASGGEQR